MKVSFQSILVAIGLSLSMAANGEDYLATEPLTSYVATDITPQNADFDLANNMFIAHPGWLNDKDISYYKFNIYSPPRYPGVINGPPDMSTSADVPVQEIYFPTTTGDFAGVLGKPILQYHHVDGVMYSDFMRVVFVTVPVDHVADTLKSVGDIEEGAFVLVPTDMILNLPVVPTGSTLQHPATKGTTKAPIDPVLTFYRGQMVTTYLFEVTDQAAKDYFDPLTRPAVADADDFAIHVTSFATGPTSVFAIPLWHVNQYTRGVTPGMGGGPSPDGMRNIIASDRGDPGYSPLWQLNWLTELPINYSADQVSHFTDLTAEDGFVWATTPMFVNCPDIGAVGTEMNPLRVSNDDTKEFDTAIDLNDAGATDSFWILGTDASLIFQPDVDIAFRAGPSSAAFVSSTARSSSVSDFSLNGAAILAGTVLVGTTKTTVMGAYEYQIAADDVPSEAEAIYVVIINAATNENNNDIVIREIPVVQNKMNTDDTSAAPRSLPAFFLESVLLASLGAAWLFLF
eukprot:scaffold5111_cov166-Amphora_coffeaeformis.AAC.8